MKNYTKVSFFSFTKGNNNYKELQEVYCDSKSLFNKFMLALTAFFALVLGGGVGTVFYFDFVDNRLSYNFTNLILVSGVLLLIIFPVVYYSLKIINFNLYIDSEKINYKTLFGKVICYSLNEVLKAKFFGKLGTSTEDVIIITFNDKRKVKISKNDRNFRMLKSFLISRNMLES